MRIDDPSRLHALHPHNEQGIRQVVQSFNGQYVRYFNDTYKRAGT
jgi:hypothetical protein